MGKPLYRFREINNNSINSFMNDEIYGTTPDHFNDPYDAIFNCDYDILFDRFINDDEIRKIMSDIVYNEIIIEKKSFTKIEAEELITNKEFMRPWIKQNVLTIVDILRRQMVISSFCDKVTKEIMWSHYTNYGSGFALEYDEDDILKLRNDYIANYKNKYPSAYSNYDSFGLKKVDYSANRLDGTNLAFLQIGEMFRRYCPNNISISPKKYELDKESFKSLVLYKDKSWEYEDEIRLVLPNERENESFSMVGIVRPKAVYLGEFISFNDMYLICSIAKTKSIPVYAMISSLEKKRFGLKKRVITESELDEILKKFKKINFYD